MYRFPAETCSAGPTRLLPTLLPFLGLALLLGGSLLAGRGSLGNLRSDSWHALSGENRFNSTEPTFVAYYRIDRLIADKDDAGALSVAQSLRSAPVRADGQSFRDPRLNGYSPMILMGSLAVRILIRAKEAGAGGNWGLCQRYVAMMYRIGDSLADSATPTISGTRLAYDYHSTALHLDIWQDETRRLKSVAAKQSRLLAIRHLWDTDVQPLIVDDLAHQTIATGPEVEAIASAYRTGWDRIGGRPS